MVDIQSIALIVVKCVTLVLCIVFLFSVVTMFRQLTLVNRALKTKYFPILAILGIINIILVGIFFILAIFV